MVSRKAASLTPAARAALTSSAPIASGVSVSFSRKASAPPIRASTGAVRQSASTALTVAACPRPNAFTATAVWLATQ